jgi:hypothetical protein
VDCELLAHFGHLVNLHMRSKAYDEDVAFDEPGRQNGLGGCDFCVKWGLLCEVFGVAFVNVQFVQGPEEDFEL